MAGISTSTAESRVAQHTGSANYTPALASLTVLFFMMGFITCLNDVLIPFLKNAFALNYTQSMLVQFCFFTAYLVMSIPSGLIIQKVGYKMGMILGFLGAGVGCLLFYPAAVNKMYPLFLMALFILASGITLLQVAANPYVAVLGKPETASSRLTLTQAFNSVGTTIAPYFGSALILVNMKEATAGASLSEQEIEANLHFLKMPYIGIAVTLFLIATALVALKLPRIATHPDEKTPGSAWDFSHLRYGTLGIFAYVGAEVAIGSFLIMFMAQKDVAGLTEHAAGQNLSLYWGGAMVGRFIGAVVLQKLKPGYVLAFTATMAILLIGVAMTVTGKLAMWSLLGVGLFNSIMFATIFTLAVAGLGDHTTQGSGILCTAIVGGAVIPFLQGVITDALKESTSEGVALRIAFILPIICYVYIAWYGVKGYIPKKAE